MFSHVFVSVSDFEVAYRFHSAVMQALRLPPRFHDANKPWAGWNSREGGRPLFVISRPFDGEPHHAGNGQMVAFTALTRAMVDAVHSIALANGGHDEGAPGLRAHYHPHYYAAYYRDPDGNKFCVVCHDAPGLPNS